jgi:hypothetical protein
MFFALIASKNEKLRRSVQERNCVKIKNNYFIVYQLVGCKEDCRKPVETKKEFRL